jgi:hypothetical protein
MNEAEQFIILEKQLQPYIKILAQAADVIMDQHVSKYPIFVVHQQEISIGIELIEAGKEFNWSVNASTLEEFVTKNIIFMDKSQEFISSYKNPENYLCLFVLSELGAQFIYLHR